MIVEKTFSNEIPASDLDVAEAFGLSDGFETTIRAEIQEDYDVILITGESGSGKTVIAREIGITKLPEFSEDVPIADALGIKHEQSLRMLSSFGLGDAKLFTLPYEALSDSQQARFRAMAATVATPVGGRVVIDEFLTTLDRSTARFVAYSIRKAIVRSGRRLVAVTSMDDIAPWLMPDQIVSGKAFPCRFATSCGLRWDDPLSAITYRYGTKDDYRRCSLGDLHYRGKYTGGPKEYLFALFDGEEIAVLLATNRISDDGRRIARLVVHPKARGCGIGARLVRRYLEDFPDTDVVASMARFSSVFESAGMERAKDSIQMAPMGLQRALEPFGFDAGKWHSIDECRALMQDDGARHALSRFSSRCTKLMQPGGEHLTASEIAERIVADPEQAGRILWWLRPRRYAKYVHKSE